jgi:polyhydroxybutyrate depolymerase
MRIRSSWAIVAIMTLTIACRGGRLDPSSWGPGTRAHALRIGDTDRSFLLHRPAAPRRNRFGVSLAYPLILVLHGSGAGGETVQSQSGMDRIADSLHFLVAYPNGVSGMFGLGSDWNAGKCCGNAARNNVDDLAFLRGTVDEIARHVAVDRRRVYVAGFSDGGRMAYRVACDAATMVAAVGVVAGSVVDDTCTPARAVPLISFHGTADREVPYGEPPEAQSTGPLVVAPGIPPSVQYWATANHCHGATVQRASPHVTRVQFDSCAADVVFYAGDGGGHAWPGGEKDGDDGAEPTREVSGTATMVAFFLRHPMR